MRYSCLALQICGRAGLFLSGRSSPKRIKVSKGVFWFERALRRTTFRTPKGCRSNPTASCASPRAVDCDFESRADGAHLRLGESAKPIYQHPDGVALVRIQIHRGAARDRVGTGFENNLACQPPDDSGAVRLHQYHCMAVLRAITIWLPYVSDTA